MSKKPIDFQEFIDQFAKDLQSGKLDDFLRKNAEPLQCSNCDKEIPDEECFICDNGCLIDGLYPTYCSDHCLRAKCPCMEGNRPDKPDSDTQLDNKSFWESQDE